MSSKRHLPSIRTFGGIVAAALAVMPRHVHGVLPQNKNCNDQFNEANVTGSTTFISEQISALQKQSAGGPGQNELSWTLTLNAPGSAGVNDFVHKIWLGTPPDINLDDGNNPFSACAIVFTDLPYNTILAANTAPSGDCTPTFGSDCVNALTKKAEDIANGLTSNCTPGANSNCSISEVCQTLFSQLGQQDAMPAECVPYFDIGTNDRAWPSANVSAITSNVGDHSHEECSIVPKGNRGFTFVPTFRMSDDNKHITGNLTHNTETYDNLTVTPYPILSVFMPPANGTRSTSTITPASAQMRCLRAEHEAADSRAIAKLPSPTPVYVPGQSPPLSAGAIAGIVVGALVFIALIVLAGICLWRRRRRAKDREEATRLYGERQPSMGSNLIASGSVLSSSTRSGMLSTQGSVHDPSKLHEAPQNPRTTIIAELPPDGTPRAIELNGADNPMEMAAHEARVRQSMMSMTATPASAWPRDHRDPYAPPLPPLPSEISSAQSSSLGFTAPPSSQPASSDYATSQAGSSSIQASPQDDSPQQPHQYPGWGSAWSATTRDSPVAAPHQRVGSNRPPLPPIRTSVARGWMTPVERKEGDGF